MFGVGIVEVLLFLGLTVGLVALLTRKDGDSVPPSRESRLVGATRLVGLGFGGLAAWWVFQRGSLGTGPMLAPAVLGLCVLLAVTAGEVLVRPSRPAGPRSASLRPRRVRDYLPPRLAGGVLAQLLAIVMLLTLTTLTAGRDEYFHTMRVLTCSSSSGGSSAGPYPGAYYSLPLAVVLLGVLVVAWLACRLVVRRPRGNGPVDGDDALRRRSLSVVVSATGIALSAPYLGVATTAGLALQRLGTAEPSCAASWMRPTGIATALSTLPAAALLLVCVAVLLAGRPRLAARPSTMVGTS